MNEIIEQPGTDGEEVWGMLEPKFSVDSVIDPATDWPGEWPKFEEGDEVVVSNVLFVVQRVGATNLVLRPHIGPGQSARVVMARMGKKK